MPNNASAAKRLRQNEKARLNNKARKTELKTLVKQLERAVHDKDVEQAETIYRRYAKRLDQATCRNVVHKNNASRHKSLMAKKVQTLNQG